MGNDKVDKVINKYSYQTPGDYLENDLTFESVKENRESTKEQKVDKNFYNQFNDIFSSDNLFDGLSTPGATPTPRDSELRNLGLPNVAILVSDKVKLIYNNSLPMLQI